MDRHPRPPSQTSHALALMMAMFVTWTLGMGGLMEGVFLVEILAWYWWSDGG
jgi:hypothetical protein